MVVVRSVNIERKKNSGGSCCSIKLTQAWVSPRACAEVDMLEVCTSRRQTCIRDHNFERVSEDILRPRRPLCSGSVDFPAVISEDGEQRNYRNG